MVRIEGWTGTLRGIGAVVGGAGPAHSLFFASYEFSKRSLRPIINNDQMTYALSGVVATIFHDAIMTPADGEYSASCSPVLVETHRNYGGRTEFSCKDDVRM